MIDFCHQMNVYGQQIGTLLAVIFTMLAFSKVGKKHREETAYTAVVGISLLCLVNIFLSGPLGHVMNLVKTSSNSFVHVLWSFVVATVIITVLLMIAGKPLKVKSVVPKSLAICFFVGIALANLVGMAINNQCSAPAKATKNNR